MDRSEKELYRQVVNETVSSVQTVVEGTLRTTGLDTLSGLSTNLSVVDQAITSDTLKGKCGTICDDLKSRLEANGMPVEMCISGERNSNWHRYLRKVSEGVEVIIDPSIGQFIQGHTQVFVGTRDQLKQLILNLQTPIINTTINKPHEFFLRSWGSRAQTV